MPFFFDAYTQQHASTWVWNEKRVKKSCIAQEVAAIVQLNDFAGKEKPEDHAGKDQQTMSMTFCPLSVYCRSSSHISDLNLLDVAIQKVEEGGGEGRVWIDAGHIGPEQRDDVGSLISIFFGFTFGRSPTVSSPSLPPSTTTPCSPHSVLLSGRCVLSINIPPSLLH